MKSLTFRATFLSSLSLLPALGQNMSDAEPSGLLRHAGVSGMVAASTKAEGIPADEGPVVASQNVATLEPGMRDQRDVESVADLTVLRNSMPPDASAVGDLERISATYREPGKTETDCRKAALAVEQLVKLNPSELLSILETEISANSQCGCEIVKSAILATNAEAEEVVAIVETAILAAPESMRLISQCAIAASPDSLAAVQAVLAKYDSNAGEADSAKSAKDAKGAKVAFVANEDEVAPGPNPLDFPGVGPVGPTQGGPGGQPLIPQLPPIVIPPVTTVDP